MRSVSSVIGAHYLRFCTQISQINSPPALSALREKPQTTLCLRNITFPLRTTDRRFIWDLLAAKWHLYLLSVTSLFNIFIWRPINKKSRPCLGRNPSEFNLWVHKALHLSKWHFPISAFDSIDFFPSLQPSSLSDGRRRTARITKAAGQRAFWHYYYFSSF